MKLKLLEDVFQVSLWFWSRFSLRFDMVWCYCPDGKADAVYVQQEGGKGSQEEKVCRDFLGVSRIFEDLCTSVRFASPRGGRARTGVEALLPPASLSSSSFSFPPSSSSSSSTSSSSSSAPGQRLWRQPQKKSSPNFSSCNIRFKPSPLMFHQWGRESRHHLPNNFLRRWSIHKTRSGVI